MQAGQFWRRYSMTNLDRKLALILLKFNKRRDTLVWQGVLASKSYYQGVIQ